MPYQNDMIWTLGDSAADLFDLAKQEKQTKQSSKSNMSWKR